MTTALIPSRFTYDRSVQRDVADALASVRSRVPTDHVITVDHVVMELVDLFHEVDPSFDADDFCRRARHRYDTPDHRQPPQHEGEPL